MPSKKSVFITLLICLALFGACSSPIPPQVSGKFETWHPVTITAMGPASEEMADPNPFLDLRLDGSFTHQESGRTFDVPGYFAADGSAAESGSSSGSHWRIHFVPESPGVWDYRLTFRKGPRISLSSESSEGEEIAEYNRSGSLEISSATSSKGDLVSRGQLQYTGARYLRYAASGKHYLKSGADSPENFLAYEDFDGDHTIHEEIGIEREGEAALAPRHRYEPHVIDWQPGDPSWKNGKGKGMIGALNYLASKGVNSVYFLTMNIGGDGDDVWPYSSKNERFRFDCSKLDQWNIVFDHMDNLGIMLHIVLTETENESLFEAEEGDTVFADRRKIYYRELVARFAHHSAITWNIGEENGWNNGDEQNPSPKDRANTDEQRKSFANFIRGIDPYDHPIVVHTLPGRYDEIYIPLLAHPTFEGPSLQMHQIEEVHSETIKWIDRSAEAGRQWFVSLDEIGPADTGVKPDSEDPDHDAVRRYALWGNLMAGGAGCEWYFGYQFAHNDLNLEDYRSREIMWNQTRIAVEFFQDHLPFWEMKHADSWVRNKDAFCFAKPGEIYAVYLGRGGNVRLWLPDADYGIQWFDPRHGGQLVAGSVKTASGPGFKSIGRPPSERNKDWVALIRLDGERPETIPSPPE